MRGFQKLQLVGSAVAAPGPRAQALQFGAGTGAPRRAGSSQVRDGARVSCTGRRVLYH